MSANDKTPTAEFARYLRLEIPLSELRRSLAPDWLFERHGEDFRLDDDHALDEPISFNDDHVRNAIDLALAGRIGIDALQEWANLLLMADAYEPDQRLTRLELDLLLQHVHELASPSIFNGLERQTLLRLRKEIDEAARAE